MIQCSMTKGEVLRPLVLAFSLAHRGTLPLLPPRLRKAVGAALNLRVGVPLGQCLNLLQRVIINHAAVLADATKERLSCPAKRPGPPAGGLGAKGPFAMLEDVLKLVVDNPPMPVELDQEPI